MMRIAIRMDDITADMDWAKFARFKGILDRAGIRPLIGVVPDPLDPKLHIEEPREDFWEEVLSLERAGWVIAMHGVDHVYRTKKGGLLPLNRQSELAGLSYEHQLAAIRQGCYVMAQHGMHPAIYMAPSHSYDRNTLRALKECGFTGLTDGFGKAPYRRNGLTFYPISYRKDADLQSEQDGITTFVVHANTMNDSEFTWYENLMENGKVVSFDEMLAAPVTERGLIGNCQEYLMAQGKYCAVRMRQIWQK